MGVATFSIAFASFHYYAAALGGRIDDAERARYSRRGDRFWLLGCVLLFLAPSLILFTVKLLAVASVWFALWLVYLLLAIRIFPASRRRGRAELAHSAHPSHIRTEIRARASAHSGKNPAAVTGATL